jgi:hypothetical protein
VRNAISAYHAMGPRRTDLSQIAIEETIEIAFGSGRTELAAAIVLVSCWAAADRPEELFRELWKATESRGVLRRYRLKKGGDG